jgi:hypothetical protein
LRPLDAFEPPEAAQTKRDPQGVMTEPTQPAPVHLANVNAPLLHHRLTNHTLDEK